MQKIKFTIKLNRDFYFSFLLNFYYYFFSRFFRDNIFGSFIEMNLKEDIISSKSNIEECVKNVVTEYKNKQGETLTTFHTPTTKYRIKTVVSKDFHY